MSAPRSLPRPRWGRAVVIGGGHAGLVTARVLAAHFDEVVILERDLVDAETGVHPHVPQGHHAHGMLAKGTETLEKYFPGLRAELQEQGAPVYDYGEGISFLLPSGLAPRDRTGVRIQSFTRDELERCLRRRVLKLPEVTLLPATRCEGLLKERPGTVTGVQYRSEGSEELTTLDADLVVDAAGRSSALPDWLDTLGVRVPAPREVKAKVTYTSMIFDRPPDMPVDFHIAYQMTSAPDVARGGVILAVERDRWTCSLIGYGDQLPPKDDAGFLEFAKSLGNPHIAERIERRTSQETVHRYSNADTRWYAYHSCADWPQRLLAVGDSVCVFNPVFGQGLTVAALEADLLHRTLARRRARTQGLDGLSRAYQRGVARILRAPWTLSSNSDLMWHPSHQPLSARFAHWYNGHLFEVAVRDARVWRRFVRVINMVSPPTILFHPTVLAKVLAQASRGRRGR
ncbi:NAD(P)/FAD-dependent oxidoreductase [Streptomyces sp. NPDC059002]|uniref:NAD(P)/FAD-dependent oxidoreductase n=1 Tax=Streptomyces sp. NPDC059002 TaxID=3346690 RepID=UPI00369A22A5